MRYSKKLRQDMIEAKYPHAEDERLTIRHIIKGLSANDRLAPHIPMLLTQKYATIKELLNSMTILLDEANAAENTNPITGSDAYMSDTKQTKLEPIPHKYCDWHETEDHDSKECRALRRMKQTRPIYGALPR